MTEQIDGIYDEHVRLEEMKAGTKYERLSALVLKVLDANAAVVHDVRLRAEGKRAKHQLDVLVEYEGRERRLLVECRDFDTGEVGQGQVMKFHASLTQLGADGLMVTNTRFTKGAKDYAADEGIQLAELRPATEADMENRIKQINVKGTGMFPVGDPEIQWIFPELSQEEKEEITNAMGAPEFKMVIEPQTMEVQHPDGSTTILADDIRRALEDANGEGVQTGRYLYDAPVTAEVGGLRLPFAGFDWTVENVAVTHEFTVSLDDRIPLLIIKTLDGVLDIVVSDRDLEKWDLDDDGKVIERA